MSRRAATWMIGAATVLVLSAAPAQAICGRKSCVVGSAPATGGYDPFAGMGGMVDLMFGAMELAKAHQELVAARQARELQVKGEALFNDGDYVAAVATLQQASRLNPGSGAIRASLERAERALAELREQETARQQAERAAMQQRVSGIVGDLLAGFARETTGATPPAAGVDFMAPGGTSFFGTGGGPSGAPTPQPAPSAGAPPAAKPPKGLEFVTPGEPLFEKGVPGSPPVKLGGKELATAPRVPPMPAPQKQLEFSDALATAQRAASAARGGVEPDPIVYRSAGFVPWAVRTFAGPVTTGAVERSLADQRIPTPAMPWEGRRPMDPGGAVSRNELRARELANLAFDRAAVADYAETEKLLAAAQKLAPGDDRIGGALLYIRDHSVPAAAAAGDTSESSKTMAAGLAEHGKQQMGLGHFHEAALAFASAANRDPTAPEYRRWEVQAALGAILASTP